MLLQEESLRPGQIKNGEMSKQLKKKGGGLGK